MERNGTAAAAEFQKILNYLGLLGYAWLKQMCGEEINFKRSLRKWAIASCDTGPLGNDSGERAGNNS